MEITADGGAKYLIPAVREFVTEIDLNHGIMKIKPIEGLFGRSGGGLNLNIDVLTLFSGDDRTRSGGEHAGKSFKKMES